MEINLSDPVQKTCYDYLALGTAYNAPGADKRAIMVAFVQQVHATQKADKKLNKAAIKFVKSLSRDEQKDFFIKYSEALAAELAPPEKEVNT